MSYSSLLNKRIKAVCCSCNDKRSVLFDIYDTIECSGTIMSHQTINKYYLSFRLFVAIYISFITVWSFIINGAKKDILIWFVKITHLSLVLNLLYIWCTTILGFTIYYFIEKQRITNIINSIYNDKQISSSNIDNINSDKFSSINELKLGKLFNIVLILMNVTLSWTVMVIILYWVLMADYGKYGDPNVSIYDKLLTIHTHGISGGLILIEWFISCWQLTYIHSIYPFILSIFWVIISILFYVSGATNNDGDRYIYSVVDWGDSPISALVYSIVISIFAALCHLLLVFIKNQIMKRWIGTRSLTEMQYLLVNRETVSSNINKTQMHVQDVI